MLKNKLDTWSSYSLISRKLESISFFISRLEHLGKENMVSFFSWNELCTFVRCLSSAETLAQQFIAEEIPIARVLISYIEYIPKQALILKYNETWSLVKCSAASIYNYICWASVGTNKQDVKRICFRFNLGDRRSLCAKILDLPVLM